MNVKFLNAENLIEGIKILSEELKFTLSENSQFTVILNKIDEIRGLLLDVFT